MLKRSSSILIGALFWSSAVGAGLYFGRGSEKPTGERTLGPLATAGQVLDYAAVRLERLQLELPTITARYGDPIFVQAPGGEWLQAGYLEDVQAQGEESTATAAWYLEGTAPQTCRFVYHRNRGSLGDVLKTMLPPDKRARLAEVLRQAMTDHGAEIQAALQPILERSLRETAPVIEEALLASLRTHRPALEALGARYEETFLRQRLAPLLREEVMPTVQKHGKPVARSIGQELWRRASVWRFGWRALYDSTPLPERDLLSAEFDRYLERDAIPVVEEHSEQILEAARLIISEVSSNPALRAELRHLAGELGDDPAVRDLVGSVLREAVIENEELKQVWVRNWQAEEARSALKLAGDRLEPVVRRMGDELFGTRETGIHPDFARVLRNQILGKDRRWIVAHPGEGLADGVLRAEHASEHAVYPLVILATPRTP